MILYIARHGESRGNTGEDSGNNPVLSEKGHLQAQLLGERMKNKRVDRIFASPLIRAVQTAEHTAVLKNMKVEVLDNCYEVEDGETAEAAYIRAQNIIADLKKKFAQNEIIMVFAHGTFNNYLTNAAIGFPVRDDFNFCQENTGLTCIKFMPDGRVKIEFANDYCHLATIEEAEY